MIDISVILAVHNRKELTKKFLKTIENQSVNNYNIIVVDDGSTDGTSLMIKSEYPKVELLNGDGNLFWTASTNTAIKYAIEHFNPQFIVTVNDDTEVDFCFLENLYNSCLKKPQSIVGCFSYDLNDKKTLLYDGSVVNWFSGRINELNSNNKKYDNEDIIPLTYYIGRGVMIPTSVFNECGLYDNINFPQSWADNELIFRAKKNGYKVFSCRNAIQFILKDESKHLQLKKHKSIKNFYDYLFKQKGGGNILIFSKYVFKSFPIYGIPTSLFLGILYRILGYWKR